MMDIFSDQLISQLRLDRHYTFDQVSELTGLSVSSIQQIEQGGCNLSIKSLYLFMDAYQCDANSLLNLNIESSTVSGKDSIDKLLGTLPENQKNFLSQTFLYMIEQATVGHDYTGASDRRPVCSHLSAFYSGSKSASGFAYSIF